MGGVMGMSGYSSGVVVSPENESLSEGKVRNVRVSN